MRGHRNEIFQKGGCFFASVPLLIGGSSIAFAQELPTEQFPESEVLFQSDTELVLAVAQSSVCAASDDVLPNGAELMAIGDPYPGNPGAKSCAEHTYNYADVAKVVERLGTSTSALKKMGYSAAVTFLAAKIAGPGGAALSLVFALADAIRIKPIDWWSQALAKIALGKASYVKQTIYCNYGGGYPAAYNILTLH